MSFALLAVSLEHANDQRVLVVSIECVQMSVMFRMLSTTCCSAARTLLQERAIRTGKSALATVVIQVYCCAIICYSEYCDLAD